MSSYPPPISSNAPGAHFPPLPPQIPRQKNWFDRNWKWLVPTLLIFIVLLIGGFVAPVFFGSPNMRSTSEPYHVAVERAMKNADVQAKLGTPMKVGWLSSGSINLNGPSG